MSEQNGYQPNAHECTFSSEIFNPTPENSQDSQADAAASEDETGSDTKPESFYNTGNPILDGWRKGGRDAEKIIDWAEPRLTQLLDNVTGMGEIKREVAEHERQQRMGELRANLAQRSQQPPSSETDNSAA